MPSPPVVHTLVRKPGPKRAALARPAAPLPTALRLAGGRWSTARPGHARPKVLLVRAMRALHELYALVRDRDRDPLPGPAPAVSQADLVEARLMSDHWHHRAEAAEARVVELEIRLAAAEMATLDLRSRIVCLQGKLATTTATARYQTMALALEHGRAPLDSGAEPV